MIKVFKKRKCGVCLYIKFGKGPKETTIQIGLD